MRNRLWRFWLWLTAPKSSRYVRTSTDGTKKTQIRDMTDGHLINALWKTRKIVSKNYNWSAGEVLHGYEQLDKEFDCLLHECKRRRLPVFAKPEWLKEQNKAFRIAERKAKSQ